MKFINDEDMEYYLEPSDNWYEFCIKRFAYYRDIGEDLASLFYWSIRYMDDARDPYNDQDFSDPCTDTGFEDLGDYWQYKLDTLNKIVRKPYK